MLKISIQFFGGRGGSGGGSGGGTSSRSNYLDFIDASNLPEKEIDKFNSYRIDVWREALHNDRDAKKVQEPELTNTQLTAYFNMRESKNLDSFNSLTAKTKQAVLKQAEYDYYISNKKMALRGYDVRDDIVHKPGGRKVQAGDFINAYKSRQNAERMIKYLSKQKGVVKP